MKKTIVTTVVTMAMSSVVFAQDPAITTVTTAQPSTVTILPQAVAAQPAAEMPAQPLTVVEAAPLALSKAEELRKKREQAEVETEQKIVESLEESRMEAERERQAAILGNINKKKEEPAPAAAAIAPVVAPTQVAAPAVVPAPAPVAPAVVAEVTPVAPAASVDDVRNAVREELSALKPQEPAKPKSQNYFSGVVGMLDYDSVDTETIGSAGVAFGKVYDERWAMEVGIGGARAYVEEQSFRYRELNQFNVGVGSKFIILTGRVRPQVGVLLNYVHRAYSDVTDLYGYSQNDSELESWALDYGLTAGIEVAMAENLSVGMEYRYMSNLTYEYSDEVLNTPNYRSAYGYFKPLEERDSDFWGFSIKYLF